MTPGLKNWRTTVIGMITAVLIYLGNSGLKIPENKQDWWGLALALSTVVGGYLARDAPVTSEMTGVSHSKANLDAIMQQEAQTQLRMKVDPAIHNQALKVEAAERVLDEAKNPKNGGTR